ncbi:ShlB/FhaC/HecB family hemolysin secretion/activation protein [Cupriavidus plantarum]|uniref:ShlB/FhaC/HecB family hemolysin secretion/activation protein n=1 Tax=Cupriavidus plantarum TaxID=942865 RepID=UPI000EAD2155|nr:ShlB/FhaC/HecB family hemolysin secretion/activation protein [Cupriavidus plantarum]RLK39459.1 hemolysin activation/secretion protein [Cupriavidus plantarum]
MAVAMSAWGLHLSRLGVAVAWWLTVIAAPAIAQVPATGPLPPEDPAQRLLREQRQRELQREATQPPAQIDNRVAVAPDTRVEDVEETATTFEIHRIEVEGNTVLSDAQLSAITQSFVGHRLGANRINLLLRRFTEAFVAQGYITTRAYLGPQNLASGVLRVTVVPGRVESFQLNGRTLRPGSQWWLDSSAGGWLTDAGTVWQFPPPGDTLRLADLEQGVDQINRLRRNRAEMQILPGQTPGGSIVALTNDPGDRFRFNAGVDNYGSRVTGISRTRLGIDADNALGLQESFGVSYVGTVDTNAAVASVAVPFGYDTFSYTASVSEYQNTIGDTALLYGRSVGHTFGWNRVIARNQTGRQALDLTLTWRKSGREINNLQLDPQRLAVLRAAWSGLWRFSASGQQGYVTAEAGYSRGLPAFHATQDPRDIHRDEAHAQFNKLDASTTMQLPLALADRVQLAWRAQLVGQWTDVALFGSEQIYAGGMSTVRGFREGVIAGDRGAYLRNEIAWANAPLIAGVRVEPYLFLDGGETQYVATRQWQAVVGTGAGVRLSAQWAGQIFTSEILVGAPLAQPAALGPRHGVVLATLNWIY